MRVAIGVTVSLKLRLQLNYSGSDSSIHYFATAVTSGRISHQNHRLSMVPFAGLCSHRTRSHATIVTWPLGRNGMLHTEGRNCVLWSVVARPAAHALFLLIQISADIYGSISVLRRWEFGGTYFSKTPSVVKPLRSTMACHSSERQIDRSKSESKSM